MRRRRHAAPRLTKQLTFLSEQQRDVASAVEQLSPITPSLSGPEPYAGHIARNREPAPRWGPTKPSASYAYLARLIPATRRSRSSIGGRHSAGCYLKVRYPLAGVNFLMDNPVIRTTGVCYVPSSIPDPSNPGSSHNRISLILYLRFLSSSLIAIVSAHRLRIALKFRSRTSL